MDPENNNAPIFHAKELKTSPIALPRAVAFVYIDYKKTFAVDKMLNNYFDETFFDYKIVCFKNFENKETTIRSKLFVSLKSSQYN